MEILILNKGIQELLTLQKVYLLIFDFEEY